MLNPPNQFNTQTYAEILLAWVVLVFIGMAYLAYSSSMMSKIVMPATPLPASDFKVAQHLQALKISQADIKRGYADIEVETVFTHATHDSLGYIVLVTANHLVYPRLAKYHRSFSIPENDRSGMHEIFSSITIAAEGHIYQVPLGSSVEILVPGLNSTREIKRFSYRFNLAPQVKEGFYPWPIRLALAPM